MMWTQARIAVYLTVALGGAGVILANLGLAEYDSTTHMLDLRPIDIGAAAVVLAGPVAAALAAIAAKLGWGVRK